MTLTNTKRREHISPVLATLHWLPVIYRIDFKVLLLKALNGQGPSYITISLINYIPTRTLCSSTAGLLEAPRNSQKKIGGRYFQKGSLKPNKNFLLKLSIEGIIPSKSTALTWYLAPFFLFSYDLLLARILPLQFLFIYLLQIDRLRCPLMLCKALSTAIPVWKALCK